MMAELNPLYRYGSEYSVGRMGWLMKLAFWVWGGGTSTQTGGGSSFDRAWRL